MCCTEGLLAVMVITSMESPAWRHQTHKIEMSVAFMMMMMLTIIVIIIIIIIIIICTFLSSRKVVTS